jgi:hypothetical protein
MQKWRRIEGEDGCSLWRFLLSHLTPPDAQGLKCICCMRSAVVARFVPPDTSLLVPFFPIAAQCLETFGTFPGIEPAN